MQFVKPIPFEEAVEKIGVKTGIGSQLSSEQWAGVAVGLRERAFFSSTVESVRFLERARVSITEFLTGAREVLPNGQTALKTGSRQEFVKRMQAFAVEEGLGPLDPKDAGTIKDIRTQERLELIFDMQTRQAQEYGNWLQGQDPDVLDEFPAQRFIRVMGVKEPRDRHRPFEDQVRLKSDLDFWTRVNQDFGVPWGPWGWGCGHDVEDVDRDEAEQLGLIGRGQAARPVAKEFNDQLKASTQGLDPEMLSFLQNSFGDQVGIVGDSMVWKGKSE